MSIIYYIFIAIASILSSLVIIARFTNFMQTIHIIMAAIFLGLVFFMALIAHFLNNRQRKANRGSATVSAGKSGGILSGNSKKVRREDTYSQVLNDVNNLLKLEPARNVIDKSSVNRQIKREYIHKKTKEFVTYWGIVAETKTNRTPVKIIYNEDENDIPDYERDPPAYRRDNPFEDFEPQKLTRVMSNKYEDEEEDSDEKNMDFKFEASAGGSDGEE